MERKKDGRRNERQNRLSENAFTIRPCCATVVGRGNFVISCNFQPLAGGNDFVVRAVGHSSVEDTYSFHGEEVVGSVRVVIDTTEERRCRILANHLDEQMGASRMFIDERADVMNEPRDENEMTFGRLFLETLPADDGKVVAVRWPSKLLLSLAQLLQFHSKLTLADFVVREDLEMASETELLADPDEPFGRVILIPLDGVSVVHGELVVKVVVTLADGDESGGKVVAGCVLVIKGRLPEPVGERVDAERGMMNEAQSEHASVNEAAFGVAPAKVGDEGGDGKGGDENQLDVPFVLPLDDRVASQVADVGDTGPSAGLDKHPANVGVEEALVGVVGVELGVGVTMVSSVATRPPLDGAFDSSGTRNSEEVLKGLRSVVGAVCP